MTFKADLLHGVCLVGGLEVDMLFRVEGLLVHDTRSISQELRNPMYWMGGSLHF